MQQIYRRTPMPKCDFSKVQSNFIEISLLHRCFPVNLLHIFRPPFPKNTSGWMLFSLFLNEINFFVLFKIINIALSDSLSEERNLKPCLHERKRAQLSRKRNKFIVECTPDGNYQPLQCWPKVGICWCVNKQGEELHGSRTYWPFKPNCRVIGMFSILFCFSYFVI